MNREILFRGKRVDNGEWVFGSYNRIVGDADVQFGGIVFNRPFGNGDYFCQVEESYEEIKELIKKIEG